MPRIDMTNPTHEFKCAGKEYRASYIWSINAIAIEVKTPTGWRQIDANTRKAKNMIAKKSLTWGDRHA